MSLVYDSYIDTFFQFIAIKAVLGNDLCTDLSPGFIIDSIWHSVIAEPELYSRIQQTCGKKIHHDPVRAQDKAQIIIKRQLITKYLLAKLFGTGFGGPDVYKGEYKTWLNLYEPDVRAQLQSEPNLGC